MGTAGGEQGVGQDGGPVPPACRYGCREGDGEALVRRLTDTGQAVQYVRLSAAAAGSVPALDAAAGACVLHQDVPAEQLGPVVGEVVGRLAYPCYFRGIPLHFLSTPAREEYLDRTRPDDLHVDCRRVTEALLAEQLVDLVELASPVGDSGAGRPDGVTSSIDDGLDPNQRRAASHLAGPIRVLAPAGSGKTKTLIGRIRRLIHRGVRPGAILALAFNAKAAVEMRERLAAAGVPVSERLTDPGVAVRTFHSFGYEIIRDRLGWQVDAETGAGACHQYLQRALAEALPAGSPRRAGLPRSFVDALSRARMELPPLERLTAVHAGRPVPFRPVFARYRELQERGRCVDFDDMVYLPLRALLEDRALRQELQSRFDFLLVDEFQDLNRAQMLLLQVLALPRNNLFAVGDDDQMIYGWRGAEVEHILGFPQRFPEAAECLLSTNYRSCRRVVEHARWLIDHNHRRVAKDIRPRPGAAAGGVDLRLEESLWDQAWAAAAWIAQLQQARGLAWRDLAVLYRQRACQYIVALALDRAGIPHAPVDTGQLYRTSAGRDLQAYLRLVLEPERASPAEVARVLQRPRRQLPGSVVRQIASWPQLVASPRMAGLEAWQVERLTEMVTALRGLRQRFGQAGAPAVATAAAVAAEVGLGRFYETAARRSRSPESAAEGVHLEVLLAVAVGFATAVELLRAMDGAAEGEGSGDASGAAAPADAVALTTIHSTKGNEYANVVYFNLADEVAARPEEVEEERRVAYVAVTRAVDALLVTAPVSGYSRFVPELVLNPALQKTSTAMLAVRLWWLEGCRRWRARRGAEGRPDRPRDGDRGRIARLEAELGFRRQIGRRARRR